MDNIYYYCIECNKEAKPFRFNKYCRNCHKKINKKYNKQSEQKEEKSI